MKIVDLKTFLSLPNGTIFQKYAPHFGEVIAIKRENVGERDFWYTSIDGMSATKGDCENEIFYQHEIALRQGASFDLDFNVWSRDGCFNDDQMFLIWERKDVEALKALLDEVS